jgi:hypothetical protein
LNEVFQLKDINIPEFFTEDTNEQLIITLNEKKKYFTVSPISKHCVLNGNQQRKNNKGDVFNFKSTAKEVNTISKIKSFQKN